ncbi:MAG: hypothetical protein IPH69_11255 [Bacteroidales bacterium]|nr:hypothetical protein [Bacteroidales bacterium]
MLKESRYILILILFFGISLSEGCKTSQIPAYYRFSPSRVKKGITGCWTKLTLLSKSNQDLPVEITGELIAVHPDTLYILTELKLEAVSSKSIDEAILYIFDNQSRTIGVVTGLLFIPNIVAAIVKGTGAYLVLGIPWLITGTLTSMFEGYDDSNLLMFPSRKPLNEFKKYARFPMGLPTDIDRKRLHLIK